MLQCLNKIPPGEVRVDDCKVAPPRRNEMKVVAVVLLLLLCCCFSYVVFVGVVVGIVL